MWQVNSSTLFRVHFPPRNVIISPHIQTVKESLQPRDFACTAEVGLLSALSTFPAFTPFLRDSKHEFYQAFPPAKFFWQFENGTRSRKGALLRFGSAVRRTDGGAYTCTAFNQLGNAKAQSRNCTANKSFSEKKKN